MLPSSHRRSLCLFLNSKRSVCAFTRRRNATAAASPASSKTEIRDVRLAGRRRFYKYVGVEKVAAPWEGLSESSLPKSIESPISAGVDGTQSASGVTNTLETDQRAMKERLAPRSPGSSVSSNLANDDSTIFDWFGVTLDGRVIKTPLGQTLSVPSEHLAWAIAAEWDAQTTDLKPAQMPLMTLACTALDQNDSRNTQDKVLSYLPTDTICFCTDPTEDRVLARKQDDAWNKVHDVCAEHFFDGQKPAKAIGVDEGLLLSRRRASAAGLPHPPQVLELAERFVREELDAWQLVALSSATMEAKSCLVGLGLVGGHHISPQEAVQAARVEEEFQIANWGLVEGGHDYDRLNCSIQMHAAYFFSLAIKIAVQEAEGK